MLNANILNTKINFRWLESMKVKECKVVKGKIWTLELKKYFLNMIENVHRR